ncbi:MAG: hypothetical protein LCI02_19230 [Proteobacteria bacterium]|nr:hypothetical protein [Pseudomonadota bacterium]
MLRVLVLLLVVANGLFFAWSQGWLAPLLPPRSDAREPERLAQQLRPELITVLTPKAANEATATAANAGASAATGTGASAAAPEAEPLPLCLEAGPFTEATAGAAERVLAEHGVPDGGVAREPSWSQFTWGVVMGRFADRDAMRAKADELKRLGVRSSELAAPPALLPGLRLGNYSDRYGAESALGNLAKKGVRNARVAQLPAGAAQWWLRAARADAELQTRLKSLPGEPLRGGFRPCAKPAT